MRLIGSLSAFKSTAREVSDWVDLQWSLLTDLLRHVAPLAKGRLLDVGCGQKPYEEIFAPFVQEYIGIEHEATFAQTQASAHAKQPDFTYDGVTLPFENCSFDTVLNVQVLEHTPHPLTLMKEMARVLKPGGRLILSAPFQFRMHEQPHDYFRYTRFGLESLCKEVGLTVESTHAQGSLWSVLAHKLNSFLAFRVAHLEGLSQAMGKSSHEAPSANAARLWTLPLVAPLMLTLSGGARILDRVLPEPDETLGFLIVATPVGPQS
jgi:SAM-dependent methyltransferase